MYKNNEENIPIYWINISHRSDRRLRLQKNELSGLYNPHTRITPKKEKNGLGNISCCLSHYEAILAAWYDDVDMALIVEDDVVGLKDMIQNNLFFKDLVDSNGKLLEGEEKWNIIQLQYISPGLIKALILDDEEEAPDILIKGYLMGAACYLISKRGIEAFLTKMSISSFKQILSLKKDCSHSSPAFLKVLSKWVKSEATTDFLPIGCSFGEKSAPEEFIFGHIEDVYFSLFPLVNTYEEVNGSDIEMSQALYNYENMICVDLLKSKFDKRKYVERRHNLGRYKVVKDFPENIHWIPSEEGGVTVLPFVKN